MNFTLKKSDLNFKVYAVEVKPTTPGVENDIAVISSVPMPNWIMSPDQPSGIPRSDGDVWIRYSVSGNTFNALKQNAMMIATISAWQYVDGAWVDREAVSCQGGAWVDWALVLFPNNGTGQWVAKAFSVSGSSATKGLPSISLSDNEMICTIDMSGTTNYRIGSVFYDGTINLKNGNAITVKYSLDIPTTVQYSEGNVFLYVADKMQDNFNELASVRLPTGSGQTITLPVSDIGDLDCYICFGIYAGRTKATLTITGFRVE